MSLRFRILLAPFPFGDLKSKKIRPVLCLTDSIGLYEEVVCAYISTNLFGNVTPTDFFITDDSAEFRDTGLKKTSVVKLHKLFTLPKSMFLGQLGQLSKKQEDTILDRLRDLFLKF